MRFVPDEIDKPPYFYTDDIPDLFKSYKNEIKMPKAIAAMRDSCRLAANVLDKCGEIVKVIPKISHNFNMNGNECPLKNMLTFNNILLLNSRE